MVTWLKKFSYSRFCKFMIACLLLVSAYLMCSSFIGLQEIPTGEVSCYNDPDFQQNLIYKAGFVRDWIVRYSSPDIYNPEKITTKEIISYRMKSNEFKSDEEVIQGIIKDRKDYFQNIQRELVEDNVNIEFFAVNKKTGTIVTNMMKDYVSGENAYNQNEVEALKTEISKRKGYAIGNGAKILKANWMSDAFDCGYDGNYYYTGEAFEEQNNYEVYAAVSTQLRPGDWFYKHINEFDRRMAIKDNVYLFGSIGLVLFFILTLCWITIIGQKEAGGTVKITAFDKIPFEGHIIGYLITIFIWLTAVKSSLGNIMPAGWLPYTFNPDYVLPEVVLFLYISMPAGITLFVGSSLLKHIKNHTFQQYVLIIRIGKWLFRNLISEKMLPGTVILATGSYIIVNFISVIVTIKASYDGVILFLLAALWIIAFNGAVVLGILKIVLDYLKLFRGSKQIAAGNLENKIELHHTLPVMSEMADTINHMGEGIQNAVMQSIKSERLKTELITNVSHDLKTPLTSIISYIDLLKEEPIENNTTKEYIQILEERSNRLKQLVEDLVDASKAMTGNVKADLGRVELHELARQAAGEYMDRLEANGLQVIMDKIEEVCVLADGRHMYRVLENLLSNVYKYAMPNTRVYIEVTRENQYGKIVIKNISKDYLNIDPSELTKRFVRGDKARSTEGSGLGLAIAESLIKLQGGLFHNDIDGDLFKVEIKIPIC